MQHKNGQAAYTEDLLIRAAQRIERNDVEGAVRLLAGILEKNMCAYETIQRLLESANAKGQLPEDFTVPPTASAFLARFGA